MHFPQMGMFQLLGLQHFLYIGSKCISYLGYTNKHVECYIQVFQGIWEGKHASFSLFRISLGYLSYYFVNDRTRMYVVAKQGNTS
jgi:hypothetical protein